MENLLKLTNYLLQEESQKCLILPDYIIKQGKMRTSIRQKSKQFRDLFRKQQLENYRSQIRQGMIRNMVEQSAKEEVNRNTLQLINKGNTDGLYEYLYQKESGNVGGLSSETVDLLLELLMKNIHSIRVLLLLVKIFDLHYNSIFNNQSTAPRAREIIRHIYESTNICVREYSKGGKGADLQRLVNGLLSCLKSLIYNKDEPNSQGYKFTESVREDYLVNYLFGWFETLHGNTQYMVILAVVQYDLNLSLLEPISKRINSNPGIMLTLMEQADPLQQKYKSISLPSVTLANSFLRVVSNMEVLQQLIVPYLQMSKVVHSFLSGNLEKEYYRVYTFHQILTNIQGIFQQLSETTLYKHLCQQMEMANYWVFSGIILQSQTYVTRSVVAEIIRLAVKNTLINKGQLQEYISQKMVGLLGDGLQTENIEIILSSLQTYNMITSYCIQHQEETEQLQLWIEEFDIDTGLEDMVHHPNKKIAEQAQLLQQRRDRLKKDLKGEMEAECL